MLNFHPNRTLKVENLIDPFVPYEHQSKAWEALNRHFLRDNRKAGMVVVPTGGGKTAIGCRSSHNGF